MISAYLRIKKNEEISLMKLSKEVNMQRLEKNMPVLKESEILHLLINEAFKKAIAKDGNIIIE